MQEPQKKKMGRPRSQVNLELLASLAALPSVILTQEEIISVMQSVDRRISQDTVARAIRKEYKMTFAEYRSQKQEQMKSKLIGKQFQVALEGNPTMLIWLGKNYCGQGDREYIPPPVQQEIYAPPKFHNPFEVKDAS